MKLSVLDLLYLRTGQSTADVVRSSAHLARIADGLGYERYWVAEHHNMPTAASTVPGVIIPYLAAGTTRIRFGSGGVMLPNHSPLSVAEQFALLEAMYPGRIDLGLGRAAGADGATAYLLRGAGASQSADDFPNDVELVSELLELGRSGDRQIDVALGDRRYGLRPTPLARSTPDLWLLGSSGSSARLAAQRGLPYVFAHHVGMAGVEDALRAYREQYRPSPQFPQPRTLLPVNVVAHPDAREAERQARPMLIHMVSLQTGAPLAPIRTLEEADQYRLSPREEQLVRRTTANWLVGTPSFISERLESLKSELGVDEFMVVPIAGDSRDTDPMAAGNREDTLRLLAAESIGQ